MNTACRPSEDAWLQHCLATLFLQAEHALSQKDGICSKTEILGLDFLPGFLQISWTPHVLKISTRTWNKAPRMRGSPSLRLICCAPSSPLQLQVRRMFGLLQGQGLLLRPQCLHSRGPARDAICNLEAPPGPQRTKIQVGTNTRTREHLRELLSNYKVANRCDTLVRRLRVSSF